MRFTTTLLSAGKTATGIPVPFEVVEGLGGGKHPAVTVTVNGYSYRSSIASMGGQFLIPVSGERRAAAGISGGDPIDVDVQLDTAPRSVQIPDDLAAALALHPDLGARFDALSFSRRNAHVLRVTSAKTSDTRTRRIEKVVESLGS